eukprot:361176-Chlamydomonas_euryale.AAC.3
MHTPGKHASSCMHLHACLHAPPHMPCSRTRHLYTTPNAPRPSSSLTSYASLRHDEQTPAPQKTGRCTAAWLSFLLRLLSASAMADRKECDGERWRSWLKPSKVFDLRVVPVACSASVPALPCAMSALMLAKRLGCPWSAAPAIAAALWLLSWFGRERPAPVRRASQAAPSGPAGRSAVAAAAASSAVSLGPVGCASAAFATIVAEAMVGGGGPEASSRFRMRAAAARRERAGAGCALLPGSPRGSTRR